MTIERLILQNFKRYAAFDMAFEDGLYGILGRNGSGKSTIFEAIFFALYGEYRGGKELIKTAGSPGNVNVTLWFNDDEKSYCIEREFRGKNLVAYATLKEAERSVATGTREVTQAVTKLLGMGREAFLHTVFASQKELTALGSMKNDERKGMMRRLLGLEKIDAIESMIRERLRDLNRDIKTGAAYLLEAGVRNEKESELKTKRKAYRDLDTRLEALKTEARRFDEAYAAAKAAVEAQQKAREARQQKAQALERSRQTLTLHEKQSAALETELKTLQDKAEHYRAQLPLKAELDALEKALAEQETLKAKFLTKEGLEREQAQLRQEFVARREEAVQLELAVAPLEAVRQQLKGVKTKVQAQKEALQALKKEEGDLQAAAAAAKSKIADVQKRAEAIAGLGRESPCPVCTRPLLEQYNTVLNALNAEITDVYGRQVKAAMIDLNALNVQSQKAQKALDEAEADERATDRQLALLQSRRKDLKAARERFAQVERRGMANKTALEKLGDVAYDAATHETLGQKRRTLKPQVEALLGLEALVATIPEKTAAKAALQTQITADKDALQTRQKLLEQDAYSEAEHLKVREQAQQSEAAREAHTARLHRSTLEYSGIGRDIEALEKELARDDAQRAALQTKERDRDDYEKLKAVMAEFKTHVNARVAPRIGEIAGEMFARITRGRYQHIEVSPEFDFFIYDNGEKYPIERFSGGEIDLANLVLRIAVSKTLGELSGNGNIGFLAFDEVFGSQDEERRFQIMEAFHTISELYRQIFLISHETEIKEMFGRVKEL